MDMGNVYGVPFFNIDTDLNRLKRKTPIKNFTLNMVYNYKDYNDAITNYVKGEFFNWNRIMILFDERLGKGLSVT